MTGEDEGGEEKGRRGILWMTVGSGCVREANRGKVTCLEMSAAQKWATFKDKTVRESLPLTGQDVTVCACVFVYPVQYVYAEHTAFSVIVFNYAHTIC